MDNYVKLNLIELRDETLAFEKHPFGTTLVNRSLEPR